MLVYCVTIQKYSGDCVSKMNEKNHNKNVLARKNHVERWGSFAFYHLNTVNLLFSKNDTQNCKIVFPLLVTNCLISTSKGNLLKKKLKFLTNFSPLTAH